ncbi:YdcF family protein [Microseira sp. BLCC-F43]|uniref:YdcF family protein n=1 Tax=Microseira sp. BLCC-F43 TaxID=3153602 RepID=UPI0035B7CDAB
MQLSGKIKKRLRVISLGVASAFLVVIGYIAFSIYIYGTQQNDIKADAAIVLGAAVWGNQPSPVFRERINHGIQLYKTGKVQTIIFTGGVGNSNEPAEAIVARNYAFAQRAGGISLKKYPPPIF